MACYDPQPGDLAEVSLPTSTTRTATPAEISSQCRCDSDTVPGFDQDTPRSDPLQWLSLLIRPDLAVLQQTPPNWARQSRIRRGQICCAERGPVHNRRMRIFVQGHLHVHCDPRVWGYPALGDRGSDRRIRDIVRPNPDILITNRCARNLVHRVEVDRLRR